MDTSMTTCQRALATFGGIGILLVLHPPAAEGQILSRIKKRIQQRVEGSVEGAVDRAVDRVTGCVAGDEPCLRKAREAGAGSAADPLSIPATGTTAGTAHSAEDAASSIRHAVHRSGNSASTVHPAPVRGGSPEWGALISWADSAALALLPPSAAQSIGALVEAPADIRAALPAALYGASQRAQASAAMWDSLRVLAEARWASSIDVSTKLPSRGGVRSATGRMGAAPLSRVLELGRVLADPGSRLVEEGSREIEIKGRPANHYTRTTRWDENGRLGEEVVNRMTVSIANADGIRLEIVQEITQFSEISYCPNSAGVAAGTFRFMKADDTRGFHPGQPATRQFSEVALSATTVGRVSDAAELTGIEVDLQSGLKIHAMGNGDRLAAGGSLRLVGEYAVQVSDDALAPFKFSMGEIDPASLQFDLLGTSNQEAAITALGKTAGAAGSFLESQVRQIYKQARSRWRGGHCIEVRVTEGNGGDVSPGQPVKVVAHTRHRRNEGAEQLPIGAESFGGSISPREPIPSEGTWTLTASEKNPSVELTSVSKRGIGYTTVNFGTAALRLRVAVRSYDPKLKCYTWRYWQGPLRPQQNGQIVAGTLKYHDRYEGEGCRILSGERVLGTCTGESRGEYEARARVSDARVPEDANPIHLSEYARRHPDAESRYGMTSTLNDKPARRVTRTRMEMSVRLRNGTLSGNNSCILNSGAGYDGYNKMFSGVDLPIPAFFLPLEGERTELVHHYGDGNEIRISLAR